MRRQKGFVSVVAGLCAAIGIVPSGAAEAGCEGSFPNPRYGRLLVVPLSDENCRYPFESRRRL